MPDPGTVTLVGAGPGDPLLITLAGVEALRRADAIVYDKLVPVRLLDWAPNAERYFVGKQAGHLYTPQVEINQLLVRLAQQGKRVVRLKGGDPLIFARGSEEMETLAEAKIPFEIIPGVTAALGAAATAAIPLTHRGHASLVTFVTGHDDPEKATNNVDWKGLAKHPGTLVIYMARTKLAGIAQELLEGGMDPSTPFAFIQWGGSNRQRVVTSTLEKSISGAPAEIGTPMIAIVGPLVTYREQLQWLERKPLFGRTILLLRAPEQNESVARELENLGAEVLVEPVIRIEPPRTWSEVDQVIEEIGSFDWIVFSSRNGVRHFIDRLLNLGKDVRALANSKIAAIGPGTGEELRLLSLRADLIPSEHRAEGLAAELLPHVNEKKILLVRADRGRTVLEEQLGPVAREVKTVVTYRQVDVTQPSGDTLDRLRKGEITDVLLTSSNIARGFFGWLDEETRKVVRERTRVVSISPVTSGVIRELGFDVAREAKIYTMEGMIEALLEHS